MSKAFEQYPVAVLLHTADLMATYLDEQETRGELRIIFAYIIHSQYLGRRSAVTERNDLYEKKKSSAPKTRRRQSALIPTRLRRAACSILPDRSGLFPKQAF